MTHYIECNNLNLLILKVLIFFEKLNTSNFDIIVSAFKNPNNCSPDISASAHGSFRLCCLGRRLDLVVPVSRVGKPWPPAWIPPPVLSTRAKKDFYIFKRL